MSENSENNEQEKQGARTFRVPLLGLEISYKRVADANPSQVLGDSLKTPLAQSSQQTEASGARSVSQDSTDFSIPKSLDEEIRRTFGGAQTSDENINRLANRVVEGLSYATDKTRAAQSDAAKERLAATPDLRGLGGRISRETSDTVYNSFGLDVWTAFSKNERYKKLGLKASFDVDDFVELDLNLLADVLIDLSPEVSLALWQFLLMCNSGFEIHTYKPGTTETDEAAHEFTKGYINTIGKYHGVVNVFFDRLFIVLFLRGKLLTELVLDKRGRKFVDIAAPDTRTLSFRRRNDAERGQVWDFGQRIDGEYVSLDIPTVNYIPLHPLPDSIDGRPLVSPSFFIAIFLMAVLRDFKRVVQHQGYPRLDIEVDFSALRDSMPAEAENSPQIFVEWVNSVVKAIDSVYSKLEPDDTYIHSNAVKVNSPVGATNSSSLGAIDGIFTTLERMAARALKTPPLLLGMTQGGNEANDNRQWEIYAKGISILQHYVETSIERQLELAHQAEGRTVNVEFRFAEVRSADEFRDAQVEFFKARTAAFKYAQGWISQDEAAKDGANKDVADQTEPRQTATGGEANGLGQLPNINPEPQGNQNSVKTVIERAAENVVLISTMRTLVPNWDEIPPETQRTYIENYLTSEAGMRQPTLQEIADAASIWGLYAPDIAKELFDAPIYEADDES